MSNLHFNYVNTKVPAAKYIKHFVMEFFDYKKGEQSKKNEFFEAKSFFLVKMNKKY